MKGSVASVAIFIVAISTAKLYADCNEYKVEQFEGKGSGAIVKCICNGKVVLTNLLCQCPQCLQVLQPKTKDEFQPQYGLVIPKETVHPETVENDCSGPFPCKTIKGFPVTVSKEALERLADMVSSEDEVAFEKLINRPGAGVLSGGQCVQVEKWGMTYVRIRKKGDTQSVWTLRRAISCP